MLRRGDYALVSDMSEEQRPGRKFYVDLAGNTLNAHKSYVGKLSRAGQTEVFSLEDCDYCVVFCPISSRVGTEVNEALDRNAAKTGKPVILVVMHHTFNPNHMVAESRRQVRTANVHLTVDCLFYEGRLLDCNTNDIAWNDIQKHLHLPQGSQLFSGVCQLTEIQKRKFYVDLAGNTTDAHKSYVDKLKEVGQTEVSSLEDCDYCVVFCPVSSRVGTDVSEALDRDAATKGKPVILVVMHHTFEHDHVVAESERLVNRENVQLTVDCEFYEGKLLDSKTNNTAWSNIEKYLRLSRGLKLVYKVLKMIKDHPHFAGVLAFVIILIIVLVAVIKFDKIHIDLSRS
ncbi:hypothetical protein INR49_019332 [Caranx melampygus]|nr:hypothetical protein INR49_019332 [Caranx melampygus]